MEKNLAGECKVVIRSVDPHGMQNAHPVEEFRMRTVIYTNRKDYGCGNLRVGPF